MGTCRRAIVLLALTITTCTASAGTAWAGSGWAPTGTMSTAHRGHAAVTLLDGRVLVISGFAGSGEVAQSELYDPATGTWSLAAPLLVPRHYATATLLPDGRVLLAGGFTAGGVTNHSEIYDPVANTWTATDTLALPRHGHVAVRLADDRVLVAGGADGSRAAHRSAEVYDPATGQWTLIADLMTHGRDNAIAALLPNGRVLVAGGYASGSPSVFHASADVLDLVTEDWTPTGSLATARSQAGTAVLGDGRVLTGGGVNNLGFITTTEVYNPATGSWAASPAAAPVGNVAVAAATEGGGVVMLADGTRDTPLFGAQGQLVPGPFTIGTSRFLPTLSRLHDGRLLVAGGSNLATAELFTPPTTRGPASFDAGTVRVGEHAEREVTIENTGAERLRVGDVTVSGPAAADFTVLGDTCTAPLAPGATCTVRVRFAPKAGGARAAVLELDDNAETSTTALTGTATPPREPDVRPQPEPPAPQPSPPAVRPPPSSSPPPRRGRLPCSSRRRIVVSLGLGRRDRVRSGRVTLNGKPLTRLGTRSRSVVVDLRRRPFGVYVVRVRATTRAGKTVAFTRSYRTCAGRKTP